MKRRIVFVAMLGLGAALGVAHAKGKQKPLDVCVGNCGLQQMICDINTGGKTGDPDQPTLPPNPNTNGGAVVNGDPGCKAIYDDCVKTCKENNPANNP